ncbi:MAG: hypothetical protein IT433_08250 [Phycisphaerales bacterium]|nr:hypothetical protein [Phycisphaerales bacterium]
MRHVTLILAPMAALWLCGCAARAPEASGRVFPATTPQASVADVHVFRDGTSIRLTNTTAKAYGPCVLWVNRAFSRELPGLAVGETLELDLREFIDEHGARFRAGGFFSAEPPKRVVLVQIAEAGEDGATTLTGLIAIAEPD